MVHSIVFDDDSEQRSVLRDNAIVSRRLARIVALIVLIVAGGDYCAFDWSDPMAPMNAASDHSINPHRASSILANQSNDDGCLFCGSFTVAAVHHFVPADMVKPLAASPARPLRQTERVCIEQPPEGPAASSL